MSQTPETPETPDEDSPEAHAVPPWKIAVILTVTLVGVALGSVLTMHKADEAMRLRGTTPSPGQVRTPTGPEGMVWIPGTTFLLGSDDGPAEERPAWRVSVRGFWIDTHEVTNAQFGKFVEATGYRTAAEASPEAPNWRQPEGPGSDLEGRWDHPVVHVNWDDAGTYAQWAGKRLPSEAEWDLAARRVTADHWGRPFQGTRPATSLPEDGRGLRGLAGNVREWCYDWFREGYDDAGPTNNPSGPVDRPMLFGGDPAGRVIRGGAHAGARLHGPPGQGRPDTGFRLVKNGPPYGPSR